MQKCKKGCRCNWTNSRLIIVQLSEWMPLYSLYSSYIDKDPSWFVHKWTRGHQGKVIQIFCFWFPSPLPIAQVNPSQPPPPLCHPCPISLCKTSKSLPVRILDVVRVNFPVFTDSVHSLTPRLHMHVCGRLCSWPFLIYRILRVFDAIKLIFLVLLNICYWRFFCCWYNEIKHKYFVYKISRGDGLISVGLN